MKLFHCDHCGNVVFFDNVRCVRCQHTLGYLTDLDTMSALEEVSKGEWRANGRPWPAPSTN